MLPLGHITNTFPFCPCAFLFLRRYPKTRLPFPVARACVRLHFSPFSSSGLHRASAPPLLYWHCTNSSPLSLPLRPQLPCSVFLFPPPLHARPHLLSLSLSLRCTALFFLFACAHSSAPRLCAALVLSASARFAAPPDRSHQLSVGPPGSLCLRRSTANAPVLSPSAAPQLRRPDPSAHLTALLTAFAARSRLPPLRRRLAAVHTTPPSAFPSFSLPFFIPFPAARRNRAIRPPPPPLPQSLIPHSSPSPVTSPTIPEHRLELRPPHDDAANLPRFR